VEESSTARMVLDMESGGRKMGGGPAR